MHRNSCAPLENSTAADRVFGVFERLINRHTSSTPVPLEPVHAQCSRLFRCLPPLFSAIPIWHRFAPTKSWTASRFQATVIPDPAISIWEPLCLTPRSNLYPTRTRPGYASLRLWEISSACLTATKPRPYWVSTKKLCNEWRAAEKSPVSKSVISGGSGPRL